LSDLISQNRQLNEITLEKVRAIELNMADRLSAGERGASPDITRDCVEN